MDKEKKNIIIGNTTTIITTVSLSLAGLIIGILASKGFKLPIDEQTLAGIIGLIIMFGFSIINAKFHNTFFDGDEDTITINTEGLTSNQIDAIQNFIDNATKTNLKDSTGDIDEC